MKLSLSFIEQVSDWKQKNETKASWSFVNDYNIGQRQKAGFVHCIDAVYFSETQQLHGADICCNFN